MRAFRCVLPLVLVLAACRDAGVTPPAPGLTRVASAGAALDDGAPVTFFAPRTVTREADAPQAVTFALQDRDPALFMEPFTLHVRAEGDRRIVGVVRVDGTPVLERRDLVALGAESAPLLREVAITASSVVTVELQGPAGGALTFWIDAPLNPPPVITITSPVRHASAMGTGQPGAFLQQGTLLPSPVEITGTACHPRYPITSLEVVGVTVPVSGTNLCEPFVVVQQSRWGLSTITGSARNARGRVGTVVQSYTRSPVYYALAGGAVPLPTIPGLRTHLNQQALDDLDRTTLDDVASLLEREMNALSKAVPARQLVACGSANLLEAAITGGTAFESVRVSIRATQNNDLEVILTVLGPAVSVTARGDLNFFDGNCTGGWTRNGTMSIGEVRLTARGVFVVNQVGTTVQLSNFAVAVSGAQSNLSVPDAVLSLLQGLVNSFVGDFVVTLLRPAVLDLINGTIVDIVPPLTQDVTLNGATLRVSTTLSNVVHGVAFPYGYLQLEGSSRIEPLTSDASAYSLVGPLRSLCGPGPFACPGAVMPLPAFSYTDYRVGLSVHQDVLNNTLWSAWRAGAFSSIDVGTLPGVVPGTLNATTMSARATMPPVSMATEDSDPTFDLAWGDLRIRSVFAPGDIGAPGTEPVVVESWVSGNVRGNLSFDAATGRFVLADLASAVKVQLIDATLAFDDAALRAAVEGDARNAIEAMARNAMGLLPLDATIGDLGRITPAAVGRSGSYYVVGGGIQ